MKNKKSIEKKIFDALIIRPFVDDKFDDEEQCLRIIKKVLDDSLPVEAEVKPAIAGSKLAETFNELRKLFLHYEWFSNNAISKTLNDQDAAKETQEKIDNILRQLSV